MIAKGERLNFDKRIFDATQESIQVWDRNGKKLFCNDKASKLYGIEDDKIKTIQDVLDKWSFFDENNSSLDLEMLPAFKVLHTRQAMKETVLKMVSTDDTKWIKTSVGPILNNEKQIEYIVTTCLDITQEKNRELKYKNIANHDSLTKLPNRLLLSDRLEYAVAHATRNNTHMALCMIDLDGFKALNDTYGHKAGDTLLIEVSKRMLEVVRSDDTVARLGGDEFVVILGDLEKIDDCTVSLYRLLNTISAPYMIEGNSIDTISASIGVNTYPQDKVDPETLLKHADVAMYKSKNSGKNKFTFFDTASDKKIKANYKALNKIKKSLEDNNFILHYQPKLNSITGEIVEVEALARWRHPMLGIMQPTEFLPLIQNDNELNEMFDSWVIHEAICQLVQWQNMGLFIKICINISPKQFKQKKFVQKIKDEFVKNNISLEYLSHIEFEILESDVVDDLNRSNRIIKECKELGLSFALDDFGTGYSSLVHLKELSIDAIKIDNSFVANMLENSEDMAIVQAIVALASAFDIRVSAEGAENIEQVLSLMEMGCDEVQGFAIAKPMPANELVSYITNLTPDPRWRLASHTLPSRIDFELLLAESNHKYWVEMIISELSKSTPNLSLVHIDHKGCRFGKWFEKNRSKNYKITPSFKDLDTAHQEIHKLSHTLLETIPKENRTITQEEIAKFYHLSAKLIEILDKIRVEVEKQKKQQSVVNKILQKREQYGK